MILYCVLKPQILQQHTNCKRVLGIFGITEFEKIRLFIIYLKLQTYVLFYILKLCRCFKKLLLSKYIIFNNEFI